MVMARMVTRLARAVRKWLLKRWGSNDSDFTVAAVLDPYLSNRAIFLYLLPFPFVSTVLGLLPWNKWAIWAAALALWYVGALLVVATLALRWNVRAYALHVRASDLAESTNRLAVALADIHRNDPDYFSILDWDETIKAETSGDIVLTRTVKLKVGDRGPLNVFWSALDSDRALGPKHDISIEAVKVLDDSRVQTLGFDPTWEAAGKKLLSRVYVWTDRPMQPADEFSIRIRWTWPKYLSHVLNQGEAELFDYRLTRNCAKIRVVVDLPRQWGCEFDAEGFETTTSKRDVGRRREKLTLKAANLSEGERLYGKVQATKKRR